MGKLHGVRGGWAVKPGVCLVAGCNRKALYRVNRRGGLSGYCSEHKHLAVERGRTNIEAQCEALLRRVRE